MLLDANALFLPVRVGFPLEAEIERNHPGGTVVVPTSVLGELDRLVERRTPYATAALAFALRFPTVRTSGGGDEAIVRTAVRHRASVVTADRVLAARLRSEGVTVLSPRDRHRLEARAGDAAVRGSPPSPQRPSSLARRREARLRGNG